MYLTVTISKSSVSQVLSYSVQNKKIWNLSDGKLQKKVSYELVQEKIFWNFRGCQNDYVMVMNSKLKKALLKRCFIE